MVKPLTTDPRTWKILGAIFSILIFLTFLFFYFSTISIPLIIGVVMVFITERLLREYHLLSRYHSNRGQYLRRILTVTIFWVVILYFFYQYSADSYKSIVASLGVAGDQARGIESGDSFWGEMLYSITHFDTHSFRENLYETLFHCTLIVPLVFLYHFWKSQSLRQYLFNLVPTKHRARVGRASQSIETEIQHFAMHKIRVANFIILISGLFFYIIGVKGAFLLAILLGILSTIPHIGIIIGTALTMLLVSNQPPLNSGGDYFFDILITSDIRTILVLIFGIFLFVIQTFYAHHFIPHDGKIQIDPLLDIILLLIGFKLLGILGLFFAIPIYLVFKIVLQESYSALTTPTPRQK